MSTAARCRRPWQLALGLVVGAVVPACAPTEIVASQDLATPADATLVAQPDLALPPGADLLGSADQALPANDLGPSEHTDCSKLLIVGVPSSTAGATWTYNSTDDGVTYQLDGVLAAPAGAGPFPAVLVNHGHAPSPGGYQHQIIPKMVPWGLVAIGCTYTHADSDTGQPTGAFGASDANILRARKTMLLLACLPYVDTTRIAAHGHSMGAWLTGGVVGSYPTAFKVASHTAGGVNTGAGTPESLAQAIRTPYSIHHGDADTVVALAQDQKLDQVLTASGATHEFFIYPGYDHQTVSGDATMLDRVRAFYKLHGLLP